MTSSGSAPLANVSMADVDVSVDRSKGSVLVAQQIARAHANQTRQAHSGGNDVTRRQRRHGAKAAALPGDGKAKAQP